MQLRRRVSEVISRYDTEKVGLSVLPKTSLSKLVDTSGAGGSGTPRGRGVMSY